MHELPKRLPKTSIYYCMGMAGANWLGYIYCCVRRFVRILLYDLYTIMVYCSIELLGIQSAS